jgi:hypothetical protein
VTGKEGQNDISKKETEIVSMTARGCVEAYDSQQTQVGADILFTENAVCHRHTQSRQIALGVKQILNTPWLTYTNYYANVLRET